MKNLLLLIISFWIKTLSAQCITFTYDAAGDRIARNICPEALRSNIGPIATNSAQATRSQLKNHDINIFPNPTNGVIEVRSVYLSTNSQVLITDILGRNFYSGSLRDGKIDFSVLAPGRYYLRITDGSIMRVVSVIKQ